MTAWRKSSFSSDQGNCVEVAGVDETVLVRNSTRPEDGTLVLDPSAVAAWIAAVRAGEFDDLA